MTVAHMEQRRSMAHRNVRATLVTPNRGTPSSQGVIAGIG
jgi:hypothetical protein